MIKIFNSSLLLFFLLVAGCVTKPASMSSVDFDEDLSKHRPNFSDSLKAKEAKNTATEPETIIYNTPDINPSGDITTSLNTFLDSVAHRNREYDYYTGYTIQVYSGSERQKGDEVKDDVYMVLPDAKPTLSFEAPFWKVKVGKFYSVIQAQKTYAKLKSEFSNAIIVPEQFKLSQ